ncbi:MAG TPA: retropepsin-like aspartic protease [Terracidiphilus sp.]|nr:retropepsin-like aspartic protease [Terracidiphilus sp.]
MRSACSLLVPAVLLLSVTGPASHAQTAKIDLTGGVPLVEVRIDGKGPFHFVVDTGTNCGAIVSPRLAKRLGLSSEGHAQITDLGGRATHTLDEVSLDTVSLDGIEFHSVSAVVTDLPDGDAVFDGILGFRLFRGRLLTLDYPHHRLRVSDGVLAGSRNHDVVPMTMPGGIPVVDLAAGGTTIQAAVDSGGLGLSVPASVAQALRFSGSETIALGKTQVSDFTLAGGVLAGSIGLDGHRFESPFVEVNPVFPIADLGSRAMADFAVTFDQTSMLIEFSSGRTVHRLVKPSRPGAPPEEELIGVVYVKQTYD